MSNAFRHSSAAGRYGTLGPEPTPVVPKFDPLRRDLLPPDYPALEHAVPETEPTFQHWQEAPAPFPFLLIVAAAAFVLTQTARLLGAYLVVPALQPLWLFVAVVLPLWLYVQDREWRRALPALIAVPLLFAAFLFGSTGNSFISRVALVYGALFVAGALLDAATAHVVGLFLARSALAEPTRDRLRTHWQRRFDAAYLARQGEGEDAFEARFLGALSGYQRGFLVLVLTGALALLPNPILLLLVLPPVAALLLVSRGDRHTSPQEAARSVLAAAESWLTYGRYEHSPGAFQSPGGSRAFRVFWTALTVFLLAAALSPHTPYAALIVSATHDQDARWRIVLEVLGSTALPLLLLASAAAPLVSGLFLALERLLSDAAHPAGSVSAWERVVQMLERSENAMHRRQLYLGLHATHGYPVFLPLQTLQQHAHILGSTGTGKTSLIVLPLIAQLIRRANHAGSLPLRGPILIIDMKGTDAYAFHAVREACRKEGRPFRFFTNVTGYSTHAFNPLLELIASELTVQQRGESMRSALNVEHGTGYGPGHFSAVSRRYLQLLLRTRPSVESFAELMDVRSQLQNEMGRRAVMELEEEAGELLTALEMLSDKHELNVTEAWASQGPSPEHERHRRDVLNERINMERAYQNDEVLYFYLYSHSEEATCRHIASFALEAFYAACTIRNRSLLPRERKQAYVFVDEFQQVAGRNFQNFMEQARSSGLALVLANQSRGQLDHELKKAVANTGYRHFFDFQDPEDLDFMSAVSGETVQFKNRTLAPDGTIQEGVSRGGPRGGSGVGEDWEDGALAQVNRFTVNDLTALGAQAGVALVKQKQNVDYSQFDGFPFPIRSTHHISASEKEALEQLPWPENELGTLFLERETTTAGVAAAKGAQAPAQPVVRTRASSRIRPAPADPALAELFSRIELAGEPVPDHYEISATLEE